MDEQTSEAGAGFSSGLSGAKQAMDAYGEDLEAAMEELADAAPEDDASTAGEPSEAGEAPEEPASDAPAGDGSCACHDQPPQDDQFTYVKDGALPNLFEVVLPSVSKFLEDYGEDIGTALDMLEAEDAAAEADEAAQSID